MTSWGDRVAVGGPISTPAACLRKRRHDAARRSDPISSNTPRSLGRRRLSKSTSSVGCCGASPPTCPGGGPPGRRAIGALPLEDT